MEKSVKDDFMRYLAEQVSPAQLSDFYICYSEIETFCLKIKVLQNPLFQTTDIETIKKVQRTIEQNKFFRITRRKQINKIRCCRAILLQLHKRRALFSYWH